MADVVQYRVVDRFADVLDRPLLLLREDDAGVLDPRRFGCCLVGRQLADLASSNFLLVDHYNLSTMNRSMSNVLQ